MIMADKKKNRLGSISLCAAITGFLVIELQPWLALDSVVVFGSLTMKRLFEAFFEASMAGAFADWFAVSALFRDPLGVHLPHTNILAKNKDSIADAIPNFLKGFLSVDAMAAEFRKMDFAAKVSEALGSGGARDELHAFLKLRAASLLASYGGRDEEKAAALRRFTGEALDFAAARVDAPSELAGILAWARSGGYDERAFESLADYARTEIGRNRNKIVALVTPLVKRSAGWKGLFINAGTIDGFVAGIEEELADMRSDRRNETRRFILSSVADYAAKLGQGAPTSERDKLEAAFREAIADQGFRDGFATFAQGILARLGEDMGSDSGAFLPELGRIEDGAAAKLASDEELRAKFNGIAASLAVTVIERGRFVEGASEYVASLLRATDEKYFVSKIEESVWGDLQYIRLNGAVVGGLVGLVIALGKAALGG
jgi:Predicted membrane protein